jgi:hypothetical protein
MRCAVRRGFRLMRCFKLYTHILAGFRDEPRTIRSFVNAGLSPCAAYSIVSRFHRDGWLHISHWEQLPGKRPLAVYAYGRREDCPMPTTTPKGKPSRVSRVPAMHKNLQNLTAFCSILAELDDGGSTAAELAAHSGVGMDTARSICADLQTARLARISGWQRPYKGTPVPVFSIGSGPNAARPKPIPKAITQAKYMAARKQKLLAQEWRRHEL